jgi:hypothetical protein
MIRQPLADSPGDSGVRPFRIVDAKGGAMVVTKIKFGQVAVQMALATVLINAFHPALKNGKEAFNAVGRHVAKDVLAV